MKILVTGGAGFIGSHLVDYLVHEHADVTVIDNNSTNIQRNLNGILSKVTVYYDDINNTKLLDDLGSIRKFDCIVHLAALADIVPSIERPDKYHRANVDGTVSMLEFARKNGVKKFIYAASGSCYGDNPPLPTTEAAPINPKYPYALTKWIGEQYALHYHKVYGLDVTSLRFFNVYGRRSRTTGAYGAVFGVFMAQKLKGRPFTVVGDGHQSRDFTYVDDAVQGILKSIKSGKPGEVYNIASGRSSTIKNLINLMGTDYGVEYVPKRPGEPKVTQGCISKAQLDLGYNPSVDLQQGVKSMIRNIDHWKDAPVWDGNSIRIATKTWFKYLGDEDASQL